MEHIKVTNDCDLTASMLNKLEEENAHLRNRVKYLERLVNPAERLAQAIADLATGYFVRDRD